MSWRETAKEIAYWVLVVTVFLMPYVQLWWWRFPLSTVLLLGLFAAKWRADASQRLGLSLPRWGLARSLVVAIALYCIFDYVVPALAFTAQMVPDPHPWWRVMVFPFQALNEEMLLGALLLLPLADHTKRPVTVAVGLAALFAALHYALYRYGTMGVALSPWTLGTLLAVGCIRHVLILSTRHIGYAWALHAAWNMAMFGSVWRDSYDPSRFIREPEVFDALLGDPAMTLASGMIALTMLLILGGRRPPAADYQAVS